MMRRMNRGIRMAVALGLAGAAGAAAQGTKADYERAGRLGELTRNKVFRANVDPVWLPGGSSLWYRVRTGPDAFETVFVNAVTGERRAGFKPPAASPKTPASGSVPRRSPGGGAETEISVRNAWTNDVTLFWLDFEGRRVPYGTVAPGARCVRSTYAGHVWLVAAEDGRELAHFAAEEGPVEVVVDGTPPPPPPAPEPAARRRRDGESPDGRWTARIRSHNVVLREAASGAERELTKDGREGDGYRGPFHWSPDSSRLVVMRTKAGERRRIPLVESSPRGQVHPKLHWQDYAKPGDAIDVSMPHFFDVPAAREIPVATDLFPTPWSLGDLEWAPDSSAFSFVYNQRGHQVLRLVEVAASDGRARVLIDETSPTFINYSGKFFLHRMPATREAVWMSERDGGNHLHLVDLAAGRVKAQITRGEWVVREVERVDEEARQVWFRAGGIRPGQDPYHVHLARVNFDGSGLTVLTEGDGTHTVEFSPDRRWIVDRWSRVDHPPVHELRRASDGGLVCVLERADASALLAAGWRAPERFVAKGRDGATDIHGILIVPTNFDPARRYPVIEPIYAGPHGAFVPKAWSTGSPARTLGELGFVVVQIDGMGTSHRSKAFHDVCWKNLADAGFPDRIAWMKAAAESRPWMDISRVGIYGGSAGGQSALGALLWHGDFYKAAAADCGCHDNRMDKIWWNEQWMGWPIGPHYAEQSNVTQAHRLKGALLLTVGELDRNVDPASTMQVVDALVRADRDFELVVIPGEGHGAGEGAYGRRRRADFFVRHLLGAVPRAER
jgi:dipeptidyl aminopeptidase/acylaminoacyl peptidase